jgi:hypothetical protein
VVAPAGSASTAGGAGGRLSRAEVVVVRPGETLWSIAEGLEPGRDPRPLVAALERQLGSSWIYPGERIEVPVPVR